MELTAEACGVSKHTVSQITTEKCSKLGEEPYKLVTQGRDEQSAIPITGMEDLDFDAIRSHIYGYYTQGKIPTKSALAVSLNNAGILKATVKSLSYVLRKMNFKYREYGGQKILLEKYDIMLWRCKFLRKMMAVNFENIIFADETWLDANHSNSEIHTDNTPVFNRKQKRRTGEGVVVCHAGTANGFVKGALWAFHAEKTGDSDVISAADYTSWFSEKLLPNIPPSQFIVIDNASYHSTEVDEPPTIVNTKAEIINWLVRHDVPYDDDMLRAELLQLVKKNKPQFPIYEIDLIAEKAGHTVVRLPLYHRSYNAIVLIWAQVNNFLNALLNCTGVGLHELPPCCRTRPRKFSRHS